MARIVEAELARLKRTVDLVTLVEASGVELERQGKDWLGLCPFHDDHEPSLAVTPAKNLWHCLGACGKGGSAIDWVMVRDGVSFREAVDHLRGKAPSRPAAKKRSSEPEAPEASVLDLDAEGQDLLEQVASYYHRRLLEENDGSEKARVYLAVRGLDDRRLIERFELGVADRTLGLELPKTQWKAGREIREKLQAIGILRGSGHEHLAGSLVVPIRDVEGRIVQLYGRKITQRLRKGTPLHLYLAGPQRGVWNVAALRSSREIILCESLLDALTFWHHGFEHVTTSYGTNGFTEELAQAFEAYGTQRVLIAYDRDDAGDAAATKLSERLLDRGLEPYRVRFPHGMDANEYAAKVQPAARSLELAIRKAEWMGRGSAPSERVPTAIVGRQEKTAAKEKTAALPALAAREMATAEVDPDRSTQALQEDEAIPSLAAGREGESLAPVASPVPRAPQLELPTEVKDQEVIVTLGDRRYRVRGLGKNLSYDTLRINLLASRGDGFHVDTFDLYAARPRQAFVKQAATELGIKASVVQTDVGKVLLKLEELQDVQIQQALSPEKPAIELSAEERDEALELLRAPDLLQRILADFESCGIVGEETNKLTAYLAATSRLLAKPLAIVVQSSSAAGKSALLEAVLALVPEEERIAYSAMTGQSLFYMGELDLKHKVLAIAEEEGAERASYALKLLQSEGELSIASTGKDPASGRLVTHEYQVEGPVALMLTTTAIDVDPELLNRCLVLAVDEGREQTRAIHDRQRQSRTLEGLLRKTATEAVEKRHQNAQRLLAPLAVVNPFAPELTFADRQTRARRDHEKYLGLIDAIALLHQHQREVQTAEIAGRSIDYVEVTLADIAAANTLAHEVLGRSLDELPPVTRKLLTELDQLVTAVAGEQAIERSEVRFTRRELREALGWSDTQLRLHLARLVDLEYVLVEAGSNGRRFVYALAYEASEENRTWHLPGLIDVSALARSSSTTQTSRGSEPTSRGEEADLAPTLRAASGSLAGGSRGVENGSNALEKNDLEPKTPETQEKALLGIGENASSHRSRGRRSRSLPSLAARAGGGD